MAKITIFNNHKGIIPQEVKDLILQSENYDLPKLVEKIIALFAVNKLIKDDKGQDKITNSNSATCNEVNKAIKEEEAKQQEYVPNQTIVIIDKSQISYNKENIYKK